MSYTQASRARYHKVLHDEVHSSSFKYVVTDGFSQTVGTYDTEDEAIIKCIELDAKNGNVR